MRCEHGNGDPRHCGECKADKRAFERYLAQGAALERLVVLACDAERAQRRPGAV